MTEESGEEYEEKVQRIKNLLSSYYGTPEGEPADGGAAAPKPPTRPQDVTEDSAYARPPPVASIDSASFNVDDYFQSLLHNQPLDELMRQHVRMASEIRSLDSDMQMLVYENYNKFISATDTIRSMKVNVDEMVPSMEKLRDVVATVAENSDSVNGKLQERRDSVEQLSKVRGLLKKLRAVFDLPKQLRTYVNEGALGTAVDAYVQVTPLLKKYGHRGAFRGVGVDVEESMGRVRAQLRDSLQGSDEDAIRAVQLLKRLQEDPPMMQATFMNGRNTHLEAILHDARLVSNVMAAAAKGAESASSSAPTAAEEGDEVTGNGTEPSTAPAVAEAVAEAWCFVDGQPPPLDIFIKCLNDAFLDEVSHTVSLWKRLFNYTPEDVPDRDLLVETLRRLFQDYFGLLKSVLADTSSMSAALAARITGADESGKDVLSGASAGYALDWGAEVITQGLVHLSESLAVLEPLLPELRLNNRVEELVENSVRQHICTCFLALQNRTLQALRQIDSALQKEQAGRPAGRQSDGDAAESHLLLQGFSTICDLLKKGIASAMLGLKQYESEPRILGSWKDVFVDLIQGQLQALFMSLIGAFIEISGVSNAKADSVVAACQGLHMYAPREGDPFVVGFKPSRRSDAVSVPFPLPSAPAQEGPRSVPTGTLLLLARICNFMETSLVPIAVETVGATFPGAGGSGAAEQPAFVAGDVSRRLGVSARALLGGYVEAHSDAISLMLQRTHDATDWLRHKEPRAARAICDLVLEQLAAAEAEVVQLIDDGGHRGNARGASSLQDSESNSGAAADGGWGGDIMERNVARMFREKIKVFGSVTFTQTSVLGSIAAEGLKSMLECVRLQTLCRAGLQQLQLDVYYLRPKLRFLAEGNTLDSLLDEVLAASVERSLDPTLLDPTVLERILNA